MEPVGSMPHSQGLSNNSYPEPNQPNCQITRKNKLLIYNSIVNSSVTYGAETWKFNKNLESKLMSMEIYFLRRSTKCARL